MPYADPLGLYPEQNKDPLGLFEDIPLPGPADRPPGPGITAAPSPVAPAYPLFGGGKTRGAGATATFGRPEDETIAEEALGRFVGATAGAARAGIKGFTLGYSDLYNMFPELEDLETKYQDPSIQIDPDDPLFEKIGKKFQQDPAILAKVPAEFLGAMLAIGGVSRGVSSVLGRPETLVQLLKQAGVVGGIYGGAKATEAPTLSLEGLGERVKNAATDAAFFVAVTGAMTGAYKAFQKFKSIKKARSVNWLKEELYKEFIDKNPNSEFRQRTPENMAKVDRILAEGANMEGGLEAMTKARMKNIVEKAQKISTEANLRATGRPSAAEPTPTEGKVPVGLEITKRVGAAPRERAFKEPAFPREPVVAPEEVTVPPPEKPPLTGEGSAPPGKPPDPPIAVESLNQDYETLKDAWFSEKDFQAQKADVETARLQNQIKASTGERSYKFQSKNVDKAIQINIDLKRNPEHLAKYWADLSPEQQRIVTLSQNLNPGQQAIADDIASQYQQIGSQAKEADVIHNTLDNYAARIWDVKPPRRGAEQFRKFGVTTRHAKARKFETILEGWANGYKLKVEGATNNLGILKEEINNTIQDKKFISLLSKIKDLDGNPILSPQQLEGYVRVEHPNFKQWQFAGKTDPADLRGRNFLQTPEGTVLERKEIYAPKYLAKNLNNIMGMSALKGIEAIDAVTKYNAVTKSWILQTSLFHHLAFMRSYYLGSAPFGEAFEKIKSGEGFMKAVGGLTPRQAYLDGQKAIMDLTPEVELGIRNGLTLGKIQDWEESVLRQEDIFVGRMMDKHGATKAIKDAINNFRQSQADFLFKQFGAGLKAKAFLIELRSILKKHPGMDPDKAAKIAANLTNDDFGGLHLKRLGRNPTTQHIFRLFALAPDWTESNIRSAVKAFKRGEEGEVYRRFWARIITKSLLATLAANALLHSKDDAPEVYGKAWEAGKLRYLDVDITPIYKAIGGDTEARKYFSIIGHFKDPLKFALFPIKSAHYKGSVIYRTIFEAITGEDWAGREFTELPELLKTGATVRPSFTFVGKPNKYSQLPSYLVNQLKGIQPIQVQQLLSWWAGETEGFDAIGQSLGLGIRTTYPPDPERKAREKAIRKTIKSLHETPWEKYKKRAERPRGFGGRLLNE
jgi:hypothetical protein